MALRHPLLIVNLETLLNLVGSSRNQSLSSLTHGWPYQSCLLSYLKHTLMFANTKAVRPFVLNLVPGLHYLLLWGRNCQVRVCSGKPMTIFASRKGFYPAGKHLLLSHSLVGLLQEISRIFNGLLPKTRLFFTTSFVADDIGEVVGVARTGSNRSSTGPTNSVLHEEKVGDLSITVTRDVADASTKIDGKNDGSRVLGLSHEELAKRNLIKGVTADESATVHINTSTLGIVVVRHCGYTIVVKVDAEVNWDGKPIPQDIDVEDQPERGANALNVNSLRMLLHKSSTPSPSGGGLSIDICPSVTSVLTLLQIKLPVNEDQTLWKVGTLPPGLMTFYSTTKSLDKAWYVLGLGYNPSTHMDEINKFVVNSFQWGYEYQWRSDIAMNQFRNLWTKYVDSETEFVQICNFGL
ncbi:protein TSS [Tanacetum coccineum]